MPAIRPAWPKPIMFLILCLGVLSPPLNSRAAPLPELLTTPMPSVTSNGKFSVLPAQPKDLLGAVVVFLSSLCPCSASHEKSLSRLSAKFPQFKFLAVHSDQDESPTEVSTYFKQAALPFPVVRDGKARLANYFGALKTPHVFVLSLQGKTLYRGAVDNSHDASRASRFYLSEALSALVAKNEPNPYETKPLGCAISR